MVRRSDLISINRKFLSMSESMQSHLNEVRSNSVTTLDAGVSAAQVVRQLRRSWTRRIAWRTFWFVGMPTALALAYYMLWASNQYESVSIITLQLAEQSNLPHSDSILGTASTPVNSREVLSIRDYLLSRSMFDEIEKRDHITLHYQSRNWDVFSRLSNQSTREQAYRYYLDKVGAEFDSSSGSLTVRVRAFEPKMAQRINESILVSSEALLENQTERRHTEILLNAEKLVSGAREKLLHAKRQMSQFQSQASVDDTGIANGNNRGQSASGSSDAAKASAALGHDLNESKLRAGLELEYAEKAHQASIAMVSDLQAVEIRRSHHFVVISKPSLPDYSTYPRRLTSVLTVLTFSFLLMGIGTLTWAAIREHARV